MTAFEVRMRTGWAGLYPGDAVRPTGSPRTLRPCPPRGPRHDLAFTYLSEAVATSTVSYHIFFVLKVTVIHD